MVVTAVTSIGIISFYLISGDVRVFVVVSIAQYCKRKFSEAIHMSSNYPDSRTLVSVVDQNVY